MKNTILKSLITVSIGASVVVAGGYKIPEQSLNSTALSAAYIANANGADASYFNPANMVWNENVDQIEGALTYIYLPAISYAGSKGSLPSSVANGKSQVENFYMPNFHYSSKEKDGLRYGFSVISPAGLSKRWNSTVQIASAEEFTLKTVELNPTIAKKVNEKLAIGGGIRMVYSEGVVKSDATTVAAIVNNPALAPAVKRDMEGDSIDFGWNIALSYKPESTTTISATYRSKIDLTEEGTAKLYYGGNLEYNGDTSLTVPIPAALNLAIAKEVENTTYELVYEKTYWSAYKNLDFSYPTSTISTTTGGAVDTIINGAFNTIKDKNWKDTNTYRLGITNKYSSDLTLMFGFAIDENPVPDSTLAFELPDSDAKMYSCGFEKKLDEKSSFGMAYLYDDKEARTVAQTADPDINGTFTGAGAHLVTMAYKLRF